MASKGPLTVKFPNKKEITYNSQQEMMNDINRILKESEGQDIIITSEDGDTIAAQNRQDIINRYLKNKRKNNRQNDIINESVAYEVEVFNNSSKKQRDKLEEIEDEIEILRTDVQEPNNRKKLFSLNETRGRILNDLSKKIEDSKRLDVFEQRNQRVKDIIKELDIEFELDVALSSEEYLEKIETDLRRQSNELDLLLNEVSDSDKKSILLQQKQIVNNELGILEGNVDPNTGVFQKSKGAQTTMETHGVMSLDSSKAIINQEAALDPKTGNVNVASHEFLHKVVFQTVRKNPALQLAIGKALHNEIIKINPAQVKDSNFRERLIAYNNNYDQIESIVSKMRKAEGEGNKKLWNKLNNQREELEGRLAPMQAEEVMTLFNDAIFYGDIKPSENMLVKTGDIYRRILRSSGVKVKFKTGKDVYNFIRDFNRSITKGKADAALAREIK